MICYHSLEQNFPFEISEKNIWGLENHFPLVFLTAAAIRPLLRVGCQCVGVFPSVFSNPTLSRVR